MGEEKKRKSMTEEELKAFEPRIREIGAMVLKLTRDMGVSIIINGVNPYDEPNRANVGFSFHPANYDVVWYDDIAGLFLPESRGWKFDKGKKEEKDGE